MGGGWRLAAVGWCLAAGGYLAGIEKRCIAFYLFFQHGLQSCQLGLSPFVGRLRTASKIHLLFESYIYEERRVSMMGPFSSGGSVHAASVAGSANNIV